jgi:hypothetical protein
MKKTIKTKLRTTIQHYQAPKIIDLCHQVYCACTFAKKMLLHYVSIRLGFILNLLDEKDRSLVHICMQIVDKKGHNIACFDCRAM